MLKKLSIILILFILVFTVFNIRETVYQDDITGAPPFGESEDQVPETLGVSSFANWERPDGPAKVALQVGHWKNNEFPEELEKLRGNSGASGGGKDEWEVNFTIAELVKKDLEKNGVEVEILPATVPPKYWADVFMAIHADGSTDRTKTGYKFAGPWRDLTNNSEDLVSFLEKEYEEQTGLEKDPNITRNMRGYYAFSWWRYEHAIHPMTTAVIAETGFLTNPSDQRLLINTPEISAQALAEGISAYLRSEELLQ